ncbi:BamA/TamA family outer membrane protein [Mucilaginibacter sp. UR6-11]|uniref:BamA/TamA family outer membrane protein n=1 Tax=Mucilaginibacter sp. UR6-11 TaxID=1435644 RepID=UPI001E557CF1|nr:BamA/TamA family outer membrane protein [Mucilaginibacter sp. UR6-11]MCC8425661.1 BamA/TamA family outer membrane protein [Mucilaginibacter sp. UR6-11]
MLKILFLIIGAVTPCLLFAQNDSSSAKFRPIDTVEKKDLIDIARSIVKVRSRPTNTDEKKKIYFSIFPVSSTAATDRKMLITSTTAGFYLGSRKSTYLSSVTFAPYLNLKGRYGLPVHSSIWLKDNSFNIQGDTRVMKYPQYTWGLGGGQPADNKFLINYVYVRFYQSVLKRITSYFYAGLGYNLDYYIDIESDNGSQMDLGQFTKYKFGTKAEQNSFSSGPSLNLLYDTRNNSINPLPGWYGNLIYRYNAEAFGSDDTWQSIYLDLRKYVSLSQSGPKNMLAFWTYYWTALSSGSPYLNLPSIGMDPYQRSGRGIEQNRYRGESLFYFETEYRRDITANGLFGFVAFANINSASEANSRRFKYWNPAYGAGLRIKFNKKSDTNLGIDYGRSKDYSAIMVNLGEAF